MRDLEIAYNILIVLFSLWAILTILWQFTYFRDNWSFLRRANLLNTLPTYTFFAPNPGMYDTHVMYRDKDDMGHMGDWQEIVLVEERRWHHVIWNPSKRKSKLVVDAISEVKAIFAAGAKLEKDKSVVSAEVKLSKGYLVLLNVVFGNKPPDPKVVARQFAVIDAFLANGERSLTPLFYSPFHSFI